jgi:hypothetical protein
MKNNKQPLSVLENSSPWFWGIPAFTLSAMLLIGLSGSNRPLFLTLNELFYFQPEYIWNNITLFGDVETHFLEVTAPIICFILSLKGLKSLFLDPFLLRIQRNNE